MLSKRWGFASVLLISIAISPLLFFALLPDEPGVTRARFSRVDMGMMRADVDAIFGTSPSNISPSGKNWCGLHMS